MRKARKLEPTQYINPLLTAKKMRDLTNTYMRHTIKRPIRPIHDRNRRGNYSRTNPADYFFVFCRQILP